VPYKHLYYELQDVMFCGEFEIFIHFPIWSCDEVYHLLDHAITFNNDSGVEMTFKHLQKNV
jgi:hypothetical protein